MKVRITVELMPIHILVGGIIFTIYGLGGIFIGELKWVYALVFLLGLVMCTSRHLVIIDTEQKQYSDFYWVLGLKVQNYTANYESIQSLMLTAGNYTQQYGMYVRRFISGTIFKMYLDLPNDEPIYIGQGKSHKKIVKRAEKVAGDLGISVRDISEED